MLSDIKEEKKGGRFKGSTRIGFMNSVWKQLDLVPPDGLSRSVPGMNDDERYRRTGFQWLKSILADGIREIRPILAGRILSGR